MLDFQFWNSQSHALPPPPFSQKARTKVFHCICTSFWCVTITSIWPSGNSGSTILTKFTVLCNTPRNSLLSEKYGTYLRWFTLCWFNASSKLVYRPDLISISNNVELHCIAWIKQVKSHYNTPSIICTLPSTYQLTVKKEFKDWYTCHVIQVSQWWIYLKHTLTNPAPLTQ